MTKKKEIKIESKKEDVIKEPRILLPFEFNVFEKNSVEKLLKCGDKVEMDDEQFIITKMNYKEDSNKYKFMTYKKGTFEVVLNAKEKQWELCTHEGNDFHPETGVPIVRRKIHETFPLSKSELKDI